MKQFTLSVPNAKVPVFLEMVKSTGYIKKVEPKYEPNNEHIEASFVPNEVEKEILESIKQAFIEFKQYKVGKLKFRTLNELLDEL